MNFALFLTILVIIFNVIVNYFYKNLSLYTFCKVVIKRILSKYIRNISKICRILSNNKIHVFFIYKEILNFIAEYCQTPPSMCTESSEPSVDKDLLNIF